jgi:hypothetical protein
MRSRKLAAAVLALISAQIASAGDREAPWAELARLNIGLTLAAYWYWACTDLARRQPLSAARKERYG